MAPTTPTAAPPRTGLTEDDLARYFRTLARAVDHAVPALAQARGTRDFLGQERLRLAVWIHQVYRHPLSSAVFADPVGRAAYAAQRAHSAALAHRLDRAGSPASTPHPAVRATAATAALWAVTEDAVTRSPRPPRDQVVADAWTLTRAALTPARTTPPLRFVRVRGAW